MEIWSIVSAMGGTGKTTLATNLATSASAHLKTLIIDLDPEKTAVRWNSSRNCDTPSVDFVKYKDLQSSLEVAQNQGFELVIIDTASAQGPLNNIAIEASNFCIISCPATSYDIEAQADIVQIIKKLQKKAAFVITRNLIEDNNIEDAKSLLAKYELDTATQYMSDSQEYSLAFNDGKSVCEYASNSQPAKEVKILFDWISRFSHQESFDFA